MGACGLHSDAESVLEVEHGEFGDGGVEGFLGFCCEGVLTAGLSRWAYAPS